MRARAYYVGNAAGTLGCSSLLVAIRYNVAKLKALKAPARIIVFYFEPYIEFYDRKNKFGPSQNILKLVHKGVAGHTLFSKRTV